ncbi:type IV secretory system conjugative DNA transfer family protein [Streptomyces sp. NPDC059881]|uniref:type IV secretory system conjugative DNA transfer family protein n=1 Tax=Streptomyces sp. NPDC059881 TaxID=3346986 RepID=UPI0036525264
MTLPRRTEPRDGREATAWVVCGLFALAWAAFSCVWLGGSVTAALLGPGWDPPPYGPGSAVALIDRGPTALWPHVPPGVSATGALAALALAAVPAVLLVRRLLRVLSRTPGLAGRRELAPLLPKGAAARARALRPSLRGIRDLHPDDRGNLLGDLAPGGPELRSSYEDVELHLMAPRSGKTTGIAVPRVLRAPGPVVLTSNKADVYTVTRRARLELGTVWTFDPQGIAHTERAMWWDMLAQAATIEGARRLAGHFVAAVNDDAGQRDFWISAAHNTLTALFHAAARADRQVPDVLVWLSDPGDRTPVDLLRDAGMNALADQLDGTVRGAVETRDGIYETARQCLACLLDPRVAAWVTPDPGVPRFRPEAHVLRLDTLYLLSKDGGGSAAGIIAAAADAALRAAVEEAERMGGRLDPPMTAVLDEAANVCRIADLPDLYSHLGSRGVNVVTLLQSYRQGSRVWGEAGMDALWGASTVKLLGPGTDDADFAERISKLVGDYDAGTVAYTDGGAGGHSRSTSYRPQRILPVERIRALPKGSALLLVTGVRPALIRLRPWYREPGAEAVGAAAEAEEAAIAERAAVKRTPGGVERV